MHKSQTTLSIALNEASAKVMPGHSYSHYKRPEQIYKILHLVISEWDDEVCVVYQAQYGEKLIFVRPLTSWIEKVEWQGKIIDRFTPLT